MSTPILDPYHFDLTAHSLGHHAMHGRSTKASSTLAAELCRAMDVSVFGNDDAPQKAAVQLMADLKQANATAYANRYGKRQRTVPPISSGESRRTLTPIALIKALQCIRYHCDGASPAALDSVIAALTDHVVTSLPEYEQAYWFVTKANQCHPVYADKNNVIKCTS